MKGIASWIVLLVCILVTYSPVAVNYLTGANKSTDAYRGAQQVPVPKAVFPIVWTVLYALLSAALFLTVSSARWRGGISGAPALLVGLYLVNIALNAAWSPVFFKLGMPRAALGLTAAMIATASAIIAIHARQRSYLPMALVIPYLAWLLFAAYLNVLVIRAKK
jgi:tryptophan-rich sensory protein